MEDRSLERRFQAVKVPPPSEEEAVQILDGVRERYETFHQVRYTDDALAAAVYQSNRYIPDRFLPDKAIDVIDEAGARVKLRVRREQAPGRLSHADCSAGLLTGEADQCAPAEASGTRSFPLRSQI